MQVNFLEALYQRMQAANIGFVAKDKPDSTTDPGFFVP
jgi:hypothetical protein